MLDPDGRVMDDVCVLRLRAGRTRPRPVHRCARTPANHERVKAWLRGLGDGYILFDRADLFAKVEGPLIVEDRSDCTSHWPCTAVGCWSRATSGGLPAASLATPGQCQAASTLYRGAHPRPLRAAARPYFVGQPAPSPIVRVARARADRSLPQPDAEFQLAGAGKTPRSSARRSTTGTRRTPGTSCPSPAGRCRSGTPACSTSTTRCARPPACSTCRTWASSRSAGRTPTEFLDLVCTNYARWYAPGESFYSLPARPRRQGDRRPAGLPPRAAIASRSSSTPPTPTRTGPG